MKNNRKEYMKKYHKEYYKKNKEERKEYSKEWYQKNKEKINKQHKKYREKNQNYFKEYYKKNQEKKLLQKKDYYQIHKDKIKEYSKEYHQKLIEEENKRREKLKLPLVGKGYLKEMELLFYVYGLFNNYEILTHHRKTLGDWGRIGLELDIYIPELKLAFEYMGKQHYNEQAYYLISKYNKTKERFEAQQYRDRCKKRLCNLKGIRLIRIKYDEKLSEQLILSKLKYIPSLVSIQEKII